MVCKHCDHKQDAKNNCVYHNQLETIKRSLSVHLCLPLFLLTCLSIFSIYTSIEIFLFYHSYTYNFSFSSIQNLSFKYSDALKKVKHDVIFDPTLARIERTKVESACVECGGREFVFFQQRVDPGAKRREKLRWREDEYLGAKRMSGINK